MQLKYDLTYMYFLFYSQKLELQNSISKIRSFLCAFTEQWVAMIETVIITYIAVDIS